MRAVDARPARRASLVAMSVTVPNPVLGGSHPDPSILRVGDDCYLATSTFEWFPGVRLHHSRDLARWSPLGGVLDGTRLLDLTGCPDSGGVWAPNLTSVDGLLHLLYSNVSTYAGGFTDSPNLLVTAPAPEGPWSDPVPLGSRGFDASLFHDGPDSWMVNLVHDWRPGRGGSAGLEATRFDRATRTLVGDPVRIDLPPGAGWIEGPNLYRRGDWYYLLTADGGTGYEHQVTVSRARSLAGPYERDPRGPLVTSKHRPDWPLQKAGHGSLVQTPDDRWYLAFLVARPIGEHGPCVLGRETALAEVTWVDDWPTVADPLPPLGLTVPGEAVAGGAVPGAAGLGGAVAGGTVAGGTVLGGTVLGGTVPGGAVPGGTASSGDVPSGDAGRDEDDFDAPRLGPAWSTLRRPATEDWLTLTERPSHLRIRGGRSPQSTVGASLVARRVTAPRVSLEAAVDFRPTTFQHAAGLTAYYNTRSWHVLQVTADDAGHRLLQLVTCDRGVVTLHPDTVPLDDVVRLDDAAPLDDVVPLDADAAAVRLRLDLDGGRITFAHHAAGAWRQVGPELDATILSDEHAVDLDGAGQIRALGFTGAFVGLWVWDLTGRGHPADVDRATYTVHG